jgi:pyruvate kinase
MLSGESAMGKYPVQAVELMSRVIANVEQSQFDDIDYKDATWKQLMHDEAIASAAAMLSSNINVRMIIVLSMRGKTARMVSKYRPQLPIVVTTTSQRVARQLNLSWGTFPVVLPEKSTDLALIQKAFNYGKSMKLAKTGDQIVLVKGHPLAAKRFKNRTIELLTME